MATEEGGQVFASLDNLQVRRVQINRNDKDQCLQECDQGDTEVYWPTEKRSKVIPPRRFQH